jgi:hypothetical protein
MSSSKDVSDFVLNGVKVLSIEHVNNWKNNRDVDKVKTVWNIHCEPHNNYFVNGLLSHNCYWPNKLSINSRPKFADEQNYYDIWFSFNKDYTFAQEKRNYGPGK